MMGDMASAYTRRAANGSENYAKNTQNAAKCCFGTLILMDRQTRSNREVREARKETTRNSFVRFPFFAVKPAVCPAIRRFMISSRALFCFTGAFL